MATTEQVQQLNSLLDQARDLMVEMGMRDENTAEAILFGARPSAPATVGNLADLQRMGAVATGSQDHPDVKAAFEPSTEGAELVGDSFMKPADPPVADFNTPSEQQATGQVSGAASASNEAIAQAAGNASPSSGGSAESSQSPDLQSMTKDQLAEYASSKGITVSTSQTKDEMIAAIQAA